MRFAGFDERVGDPASPSPLAYRFTAKDWTPKQDVVVALHGWSLARSLAADKGIKRPCPDAATVTGGGPAAHVTQDPQADAPLHALGAADHG
ncbi:hypothetical protein [uncultured Thiodictyon sp.]|uniref:hypothetical protein n=1 Tax=uncultured Thiodictyon sp. TaxID=1846217 RepID=UPI0025EC1D21|nr:hypothetical protein [uncultured Thiodictyon sp.]